MSDVQITPFCVGHFAFDLSALYGLPADHPFAGQVARVPINCYHIMLPVRSILFDAAGYVPELAEDILIPGYAPPPDLLEQLATAGIIADAVDTIVISHAHFDHYSGLVRRGSDGDALAFPNARHYLGHADWEPEHFYELEHRTLQVAYNAGQLRQVEREIDIGDGLTILPAPGETPGHQILEVATEAGVHLFVGDLYHHALEFEDVGANINWAEPATMNASKAALIRRAAATGARVYAAHIDHPYMVVRDRDAIRWEEVAGPAVGPTDG